MSDTYVAPEGAVEHVPAVAVTPAENTGPVSVSDAARALSNWRKNKPKDTPAEPAAPSEAAPEPPQELAEQPSSAPPEEVPAETTEATDPAPEPSIDPPRSWTKDAKEAFKLLPPALQRDVAELERSRELEIRRGQNEAADQRKALEAERLKAEQERQKYETALPQLLQAIQTAQAGEFADIKTQEDVNRLANEDWPRFARWQAHQMQVAAVQNEAKAIQERAQAEYRQKWSDFSQKEDARILEIMPELSDAKKQSEVADAVMTMMEKNGISKADFAKAWSGEAHLPIRHSAMQAVLAKAALYDLAKAKVAAPPPKPVPPVQKPGTAPNKGAAVQAQIEAAASKLSNSKGNASIAAALELVRAKRAAR